MGVISIAETEFSTPTPFKDPDNSTLGASRVYFRPWTHPGGQSARSGTDIQEFNWPDAIRNWFHCVELVVGRKCEYPPQGSEHQKWWAAKLMEYPPCFVWYLNKRRESIMQCWTLIRFMTFWDFVFVPVAEDLKQHGLAHCDESENWIQTANYRTTEIPLTQWLVSSDDVAVLNCAWSSTGWYYDDKACCIGIVFWCEEFDACYPNRRQRSSTGCRTLDDTDGKALDHKRVFWIQRANGKTLIQILKENAHLINLEWTEQEQAQLMTLVGRYTSQGASGGWKVQRWPLVSFSSVLEYTQDCYEVPGQWYNQWPVDPWVDSSKIRWLRDTFSPLLVHTHVEYPKSDKGNTSREALFPEPERNENALTGTPLQSKEVLFCCLPGQGNHLKWWLTQYLADCVDKFHLYAEISNGDHREMQLKFLDWRNPSVFVNTPNMCGTGLNLSVANHPVIT